jgi:hypothetical protein
MGGSALASDGGSAARAWIIVVRGLDHGDLIVSDQVTEPRSLMQELIVALRQERQPRVCLNRSMLPQATQFGALRFDGIGSETT